MSLDERKVEGTADSLRERIKRGEFGTGGRLPSVSQLGRDYGISRPTVYQILRLLQVEGLVMPRNNSWYARGLVYVGTSVVPPFEEVLKGQGIASTVRNVIEPEIITMPDEIAEMFGVEKGLHVIHRYRVQGSTEMPYRLSEYWFPEKLARAYLQRLRDNPGYDILEDIKSDLGVTRQRVHDDVLARPPTRDEASLLAITRGTPIQEVRRTNRTMDGQVLMHHRIVYVSSLNIQSYDYEIANRKPLRESPENVA